VRAIWWNLLEMFCRYLLILTLQGKGFHFANNVYQGIIIESGIDWAEDERWMDVMLSAGEET
jgi:hypothetical protein